jgi:hypothetical protein
LSFVDVASAWFQVTFVDRIFIFGFVPPAVALFWLATRTQRQPLPALALISASLIFYASWLVGTVPPHPALVDGFEFFREGMDDVAQRKSSCGSEGRSRGNHRWQSLCPVLFEVLQLLPYMPTSQGLEVN